MCIEGDEVVLISGGWGLGAGPGMPVFIELHPEYDKLGKMINNYLQYVDANWMS